MELKRVVVTGLGAITPLGNTVSEFWDGLMQGKSGAGPITYFDTTLFKTHFACEVKGFDVNQYLDRKEARKMDLYTQYAVAVAKLDVPEKFTLQLSRITFEKPVLAAPVLIWKKKT